MRQILLLLFTFLAIESYCQLHFHSASQKYEIPWDSIEVSQDDSIVQTLCEKNSQFKFRHKNFPELFHLINLNNDFRPDLLFYWPDNSNEPLLEIYLNDSDSLVLVLEKRGTITNLDIQNLPTKISLTLDEVGYSSPPFLNRCHVIDINPYKTESYLESETYIYFSGTEMPVQLSLSRTFEVVQPKYRLRLAPFIDDTNIICELASGDRGLALSEKIDSTGRVWYFAIIENNIKKTPEKYYYIDSNAPDGLNGKILGWISSRYLKEIE